MTERDRPEPDALETRILERPTRAAASPFPERIGDYRLIRLLGSGGMGRVFLAEQLEPVSRKVALKLINNERGDRTVSAFFEAERQILANLNHPFIAQVFDAGTGPDNQPWFAMELVKGEPIVAHCRNHQLDDDERLRLMIRICKGIQHAHQRGILHRDLKPANILVRRVDNKSLPKIIDFGIATSLIKHKRAGLGRAEKDRTQVGTPAYMSPEQLQNKTDGISVRCDVYALGVILFELLLDCRPPRGSSESELRQLCSSLRSWRATTRLTTVSTDGTDKSIDHSLADIVRRARQLPFELRCILAQALAYEPDQRYASADDLAEDLQHFLNHRPVNAVPRTRRYVWRKFLRRHRLATAFVSLVSLSLTVGLGLALWGLIEASSQRDMAQAQADRAERSLEFVSTMLSSIDPDFTVGGDTVLMQNLLSDATHRADTTLQDHPDIEAEIRHIIGSAYLALQETERAQAQLHRSLELAEQADLPLIALQSRKALALMLMNQRDFDQSEALYDRISEQHQLLAENELLHLDMLSHKAYLYAQTDRPALARQTVAPVLAQTEDQLTDAFIPVRLSALITTAVSHLAEFNYDEAELAYRQHEQIARSWDSPMARRHLSEGLNGRAVLYMEQQRHAEAEPLLRESLELTRKRLGDRHVMVVHASSNLGSSLRQQGQFDEAAEHFRTALDIARESYGDTSFAAVLISYNLGNLLRESGQTREALELHRWVVQTSENDPTSRPNLPIYLTGMGRTELAAGYDTRAVDSLLSASNGLVERFGESHRRTLEAVEYLVVALDNLGRSDEADDWRAFFEYHQAQD